jgi:hypothetical protein
MAVLTEAECAQYRDAGFVARKPLLTAEEAARYRADAERCCGPQQKVGARRQASNRLKPYLLFPWAAELVRHPKVLDAVEQLIGPDILAFHTTVWLKEPMSGSFVPWHQDATYFGLEPFEHVTAWVALTPSTPENGCVEVLPGSHTTGQRPHKDQRDERAMLSRGQTLTDAIDDSGAVRLEMQPGDVSFHHTLLMHRSAPNQTNDRRIGIGFSYIPAHVRHTGPTRLSATLVRGEDKHGHFDPEPSPTGEADEAAVAAHYDSLSRFWAASEGIPEMAGAH